MMTFLDLFKKKKSLELDIPPPPLSSKPFDEIPPIRFAESAESTLPEFPQIPEEVQPEAPAAELFEKQTFLPVPALDENPIPQIRVPPAQIFVSVDDYRKIMQNTNTIRARLIETESSLKHLSELRAEEEHLVERWSKELAEVERKLSRVDHAIAKAQV